jgi:hypothetical protein
MQHNPPIPINFTTFSSRYSSFFAAAAAVNKFSNVAALF